MFHYFIILFIVVTTAISCSPNTDQKPNATVTTALLKKDSVRNGYYEEHYPNGKLWSTCEYKNGKREGKTTSYYPNGNLRYTGWFKNDTKTDVWLFYDKEGNFAKEVNFNK